MRQRLVVSALVAVLLGVIAALPASAHHDDGKGEINVPPLEAQEHELLNVAAARAHEDSDAPRGFAPCIRGMAADTYPCDGIAMMSHLTLGDLGLSFANDIWGWTDPQTERDYALIGGIEGTVIVDITDAKRPDIVGTLPTHSAAGNQIWRDIKVFADHAFVVSEHTGHGLQVFDLTQVRGVTGDPVTFAETAHYDGFGNAHNLAINEDTGFAYAIGTSTCAGGLHMVDISDPTNPTFAGCFAEHNYIHDTQCVIYDGPDADHTGREICFNSAAHYTGDIENIDNTLSIVDVTDKSNPQPLARIRYPNDGYSHQGWLTPDQQYFLHNDELDEAFGRVASTTTRIFDVRDLDNPTMSAEVGHGTTSIGHNQYTEGDYVYASNYTSGLRIFDITGVADGVLPPAGFFDVYPENDNPTFEGGAWSNYPYFHQPQIVAVSSMERGLFVLRPQVGGN
jgi:choice-of-anchor B domain-containing protein